MFRDDICSNAAGCLEACERYLNGTLMGLTQKKSVKDVRYNYVDAKVKIKTNLIYGLTSQCTKPMILSITLI